MTDELTTLHEKIRSCRACRLCSLGATQAVPGDGPANAEIMFIGEGPGRDEDVQGRPFVGAAGKFLSLLLSEAGLKREDVFITNVVKHRPPENRDPQPDEVETCWKFLAQQIGIIRPKIIVTLGRHSMARFMPGLRISDVHGQPKRAKGLWQERQVYLPLYHPASALYNPRLRDVHIADMKKLPLVLKKIRDDGFDSSIND